MGKTTMALAFSKALGLDHSRVQFTPDVLPSDITGYSVYQKETGKMIYQPGAVLVEEVLVPTTLQGVILMEDVVKLGLHHTLKCKVLSKFS